MDSNKVISLKEAVSMVPDGSDVCFGGFAETNNPLSFVREMIRQNKKNLTISGMGDAQSVELLCGNHSVNYVRVSNYMAKNGRCPCFCRGVEQGEIKTEDYSHFGITNRFFAAAMGLGFMPVRVMIGSDIQKIQSFDVNNKVKTICDPFGDELCGVVPKLEPDFAIIHVAKSDCEGNCQLFGITSAIEIIARAAKRVIVTSEEIISTEEIRRTSANTILPSIFVDYVVHAPYGAYPGGVYTYYDYDLEHLQLITQSGKTRESMDRYFDEWIRGTKDEYEFLEKVGLERLMQLRADPYCGISLINRGIGYDVY